LRRIREGDVDELITIDDAFRSLADANTPEELVDLANRAEAMRVYARQARLGMVAQNRCAEIRLRAERKLGQYLADTPRNPGGRPKPVPDGTGFPSLAELGITKKLSHRAQRLAAIRKEDFEWYLATARERGWEITTRLLLLYCGRRGEWERNQQRIVGGRVEDLIEFAQAGNRMGCIVLDPPWLIPGATTLPYDTMDIDQLKKLPIPDLAADRCHLHLWTLPNATHRLGCDLIEHWGFRVVSEFVWVKPSLGQGNYWRNAHETLVTAVNAENDRFNDRWLRSWGEYPRRRHSEKPAEVRALIERASPAPRLAIFARQLIPNWYHLGA
jgi:N6-adenosine-specific RNA methylase IME4